MRTDNYLRARESAWTVSTGVGFEDYARRGAMYRAIIDFAFDVRRLSDADFSDFMAELAGARVAAESAVQQ